MVVLAGKLHVCHAAWCYLMLFGNENNGMEGNISLDLGCICLGMQLTVLGTNLKAGGTNLGYLQSLSFPQELCVNDYKFPDPVSNDISLSAPLASTKEGYAQSFSKTGFKNYL